MSRSGEERKRKKCEAVLVEETGKRGASERAKVPDLEVARVPAGKFGQAAETDGGRRDSGAGNEEKTFAVAVWGDVQMCDSAGWDDSKVRGDNLVFEQSEAKVCAHMGKGDTAFERCDTAHLGVAADQAARKWGESRTARSNVDVSYAMSWTDRVVPAGGEYKLLVCGGNPND
jgi:hypothetical protein